MAHGLGVQAVLNLWRPLPVAYSFFKETSMLPNFKMTHIQKKLNFVFVGFFLILVLALVSYNPQNKGLSGDQRRRHHGFCLG